MSYASEMKRLKAQLKMAKMQKAKYDAAAAKERREKMELERLKNALKKTKSSVTQTKYRKLIGVTKGVKRFAKSPRVRKGFQKVGRDVDKLLLAIYGKPKRRRR